VLGSEPSGIDRDSKSSIVRKVAVDRSRVVPSEIPERHQEPRWNKIHNFKLDCTLRSVRKPPLLSIGSLHVVITVNLCPQRPALSPDLLCAMFSSGVCRPSKRRAEGLHSGFATAICPRRGRHVRSEDIFEKRCEPQPRKRKPLIHHLYLSVGNTRRQPLRRSSTHCGLSPLRETSFAQSAGIAARRHVICRELAAASAARTRLRPCRYA